MVASISTLFFEAANPCWSAARAFLLSSSTLA
jgi:hypothetical protein